MTNPTNPTIESLVAAALQRDHEERAAATQREAQQRELRDAATLERFRAKVTRVFGADLAALVTTTLHFGRGRLDLAVGGQQFVVLEETEQSRVVLRQHTPHPQRLGYVQTTQELLVLVGQHTT